MQKHRDGRQPLKIHRRICASDRGDASRQTTRMLKTPLITLKAEQTPPPQKKQTNSPPSQTEREKVRLVPSLQSQVRTSHSCR